MKKLILLAAFSVLVTGPLRSNEYKVLSPDQRIEVTISIQDKIYYKVTFKQFQLIDWSPLSLTIDGRSFPSHQPVVLKADERYIDRIIRPVIREKRSEMTDRCSELTLHFADSCGIAFRVYNDGMAWRFFTRFGRTIRVSDEEATFNFSKNHPIMMPVVTCHASDRGNAGCFSSGYEQPYKTVKLGDSLEGASGLLPALVYPEEGQPRMLITEAGLADYPGLYLIRNNTPFGLKGIFPAYPTGFEERIVGGEFKLKSASKRAGYIAETNGNREFPWRVICIAAEDRLLAETDIVLRLSGHSRLDDPSWIKPGKSTSEWLYANHIFGVDFKSGYNTETYKYYIDFASRFGLEYVLFDAGWSNPQDLFDLTPEMDMEVLTSYAREKQVGLVLWTSCIAMETQMEAALDQFQAWGIKGIMVDFFDTDDQVMIRSLQRIAEATAERKIFVDFHGVTKPEGLRARYPNILTREGLIAYEGYKWSEYPSPEYEVTVPFIRMVAGPMDYEPGTMRNASKRDFRPVGGQPMSMGTRIHQLAMFVVYDSPYAKMGGNPSDYLLEPDYTRFMVGIPTVWDETRVLAGKVSDYIVTLRKAANGDYYIGAMTDWSPRKVEIDFNFLDEGEYHMTVYQDGINADTYGSDYKKISKTITKQQHQVIEMAPGGGWVARVTKSMQ